MSDSDSSIQIQPIGHIHSPYKQKFAIPRQANLVAEAQGEVVLVDSFTDTNSVRELENFSHLWLLFYFHETAAQGWTPTVQPPRLGGKERVGVFASRSPFRPNAIGMSAVKNLGYQYQDQDGKLVIRVGGIDLLHGTPIVDIKPYLPYADCLPEASGGFASEVPGQPLKIDFSAQAESSLQRLTAQHPELRNFVIAVLQQDPRPAWRVKEIDNKQYGMTLYDLNIKWQVDADTIQVIQIEQTTDDREK